MWAIDGQRQNCHLLNLMATVILPRLMFISGMTDKFSAILQTGLILLISVCVKIKASLGKINNCLSVVSR